MKKLALLAISATLGLAACGGAAAKAAAPTTQAPTTTQAPPTTAVDYQAAQFASQACGALGDLKRLIVNPDQLTGTKDSIAQFVTKTQFSPNIVAEIIKQCPDTWAWALVETKS
jgi:hypothetical protein